MPGLLALREEVSNAAGAQIRAGSERYVSRDQVMPSAETHLRSLSLKVLVDLKSRGYAARVLTTLQDNVLFRHYTT